MVKRVKFGWQLAAMMIGAGLALGGCATAPALDDDEFVKTYFPDRGTPTFSHYESLGREIHFAEVGEPDEGKPMLVFVHGSPGTWRAFSRYLSDPELRERAHMVSVDRAGFGKSSSGGHEKSLALQAEMLYPILLRDPPGQGAILVGHSYGGPLVARMAMAFPEEVGGLVMIAPAIDPDNEEIKWYNRLVSVSPISWLTPAPLRTANREILPLHGELEKMADGWEGITAPVTVIHGTRDRLVPYAHAEFARRKLVNAPVTIDRLEGDNHFIPWTRPERVKAAIMRHLDEWEARAAN